MLPIWRDNWLFLLLDEKNSRERDVPERLLVEPLILSAILFELLAKTRFSPLVLNI